MSEKNSSFLILGKHWTNSMKYMGTNTTWAIMSILRKKMIELDGLSDKELSTLSITSMVELMQFKIIFTNMLRGVQRAFENSECKPIITFLRTRDWFGVGEKVMCMIHQGVECDVATAVECHVVDVIDEDGEVVIFVSTNGKYDFLKRESCHFGYYFLDSCSILKPWEYEFLLRNVQFAKKWMQISKNPQLYEAEVFKSL